MSTPDRKRGLGRGLSALMSDMAVNPGEGEGLGRSSDPQLLPIEAIEPNPEQPRKRFKQMELEELSESIRNKGIIQPLVVRPMGNDRYQIVAGERRWRAAQMAQLHDVPVVVRAFSDAEVIEVAIIENVQRSDLNPVEEARGYRQLMDRFDHTQEKLAEALGKSRSYIANLLRLLTLPPSVLKLLEDGDLSAGHARALVTSANAESLARKIVAEGLSVRATEKLVKSDGPLQDTGKERKKAAVGEDKDADTRALEGDLSATLGMRVTLAHAAGNDGGKMTIRYASLEQLDDLCRRLAGD